MVGMDNRMDRQIVYVHTKDYYTSNEKKKKTTKQIVATCNNISKSHRYKVKQKKPDTEEYILWFLYIKFKNRHN